MNNLDDEKMLSGFLWGVLIGSTAAFFGGPRLNLRDARQKLNETANAVRGTIENAVPSDPIDESIAEGKAAARRRRLELGLDEDQDDRRP